MKTKLSLLLLLLASPLHATLFNYRFDGSVDTPDAGYTAMAGSFIYDDAAQVEWTFANGSQTQSNAISGFSLRLDQDQWTRQASWDATRFADGSIATQDATLSGPQDVNDFAWTPTSWCLTVFDSVTHDARDIAGHVLNVYKEAYWPKPTEEPVQIASAGLGDVEHDAAPVPEPSSLALLGTGLAGFALFRRRRAR